ncbi:winged helix-turn-helix transcriptional regulator, partial [Klebsiella pneumoniae]|uniref:winged helix-turn-helix transcriptional regulator n=1 Tax=Klebsiella pneumoniae TaxID=573 RepID=UPI000E680E29
MKILAAMDRSILRAFQENGRLTNTELADRINLSQTATAERVKRLTREGYILGYSARLSPKRLDRAMLVFIEIKLDRTTPEVFETFSTFTRSNPDILECHMVAGGFD